MRADVVVIGAGPAGCAAAWTLARAGVDVALLDRSELPRDKVCGDALSPECLRILEDMGLAAAAEGALPIEGSIVRAPDGAAMSTLAERPGATLRRRDLDAELTRRVQRAGARLFPGRTLTDFRLRQDGIEVGCAGGEVFAGQCAVLATGANAAALRTAGALGRPAGPAAYACRAYFRGGRLPENLILHSFDPFLLPGFAWVFPLPGGLFNVGVAAHVLPDQRLDLKRRFRRFIDDSPAARRYLAGARRVSELEWAPVRMSLRGARLVGERLLVAGDAAGGANPCNGEGITTALATGRLAGRSVLDGLRVGDLSRRRLAGYERAVRAEYGERFRRAEWVRRWLRWPAALNRLVAAGRGDRRLADALCWTLTGLRPLHSVLSVRTLSRCLLGALCSCRAGRVGIQW